MDSDQFRKMRSLERGGRDDYQLDDFRDYAAQIPPEARGNRVDCICDVCGMDCETMAALVVHVAKFHPVKGY